MGGTSIDRITESNQLMVSEFALLCALGELCKRLIMEMETPKAS
jgi:hypothetical protein